MRWVDLSVMSQLEKKDVISACLKKHYYHSYDAAVTMATRRADEYPGLLLGVYACKYCRFFHLTSRPTEYGLVAIGAKTVIDLCKT